MVSIEMPIGMNGCVMKDGVPPFMGVHPYGWIFQLLILLAVGGIIYWVLSGSRTESALDIVRKRYARGEISFKEFKKIKDELK